MGKPKANGKQTGKPSKTPAIKMPAFEKAANKAGENEETQNPELEVERDFVERAPPLIPADDDDDDAVPASPASSRLVSASPASSALAQPASPASSTLAQPPSPASETPAATGNEASSSTFSRTSVEVLADAIVAQDAWTGLCSTASRSTLMAIPECVKVRLLLYR